MTGIVIILVLLGLVLNVQARRTADPVRARTLRRFGMGVMVTAIVIALIDVADLVQDHTA